MTITTGRSLTDAYCSLCVLCYVCSWTRVCCGHWTGKSFHSTNFTPATLYWLPPTDLVCCCCVSIQLVYAYCIMTVQQSSHQSPQYIYLFIYYMVYTWSTTAISWSHAPKHTLPHASTYALYQPTHGTTRRSLKSWILDHSENSEMTGIWSLPLNVST